ncbi:MAG TPA: P-loop NTPase fold protein, partial [Chitinispirillaceae bacterium]|nr:P-loop NTPase fold protein [Chitinispirillaceae bacterium]
DAFKKLSEELIPALLSLSAISAATIAFGPEGAVSSSIATSGIKTIGNFVKNYLNKEKQKSLEELIFNFKNSLEIITSQLFLNNQKKLVFIIDELDRCRPTYAVEVIEKIKHLFSVAGVIWVLVLNKDQMEKSIKHIYGTIDTNEYLTKFIDVTTPLPKDVINYNRYLSDHYNKLVNGLIDSTEMDCVIKDSAKRFLSELARLFGLSIRETQKVVLSLQLILGKCSDWTDWYIIIALFYTILKVNKFNLYLQVKNNTIGYIRLSDKLDILKESSSCKKPINWLPFYVENSMRINNDTDSKTQAHNDYGQNSEDEYKKFTNQEYDFLEVDDKYKKDIFCKLDLFNFD